MAGRSISLALLARDDHAEAYHASEEDTVDARRRPGRGGRSARAAGPAAAESDKKRQGGARDARDGSLPWQAGKADGTPQAAAQPRGVQDLENGAGRGGAGAAAGESNSNGLQRMYEAEMAEEAHAWPRTRRSPPAPRPPSIPRGPRGANKLRYKAVRSVSFDSLRYDFAGAAAEQGAQASHRSTSLDRDTAALTAGEAVEEFDGFAHFKADALGRFDKPAGSGDAECCWAAELGPGTAKLRGTGTGQGSSAGKSSCATRRQARQGAGAATHHRWRSAEAFELADSLKPSDFTRKCSLAPWKPLSPHESAALGSQANPLDAYDELCQVASPLDSLEAYNQYLTSVYQAYEDLDMACSHPDVGAASSDCGWGLRRTDESRDPHTLAPECGSGPHDASAAATQECGARSPNLEAGIAGSRLPQPSCHTDGNLLKFALLNSTRLQGIMN